MLHVSEKVKIPDVTAGRPENEQLTWIDDWYPPITFVLALIANGEEVLITTFAGEPTKVHEVTVWPQLLSKNNEGVSAAITYYEDVTS